MENDFEIIVLGNAAAVPSKNTWLSAHYVRAKSLHLLIDCGEGTQFQLLAHNISPNKLTHIFISHLHGDHFFGLVGLLSTMTMLQRNTPLYLFGPHGLEEIITVQARYAQLSFSFPITFHSLPSLSLGELALLWEDENWLLYSFALKHRVFCQGLRLQEKNTKRKILRHLLPDNFPHHLFSLLQAGKSVTHNGITYHNHQVTTSSYLPRSYAFCSDTAYVPDIVPCLREVHLLYHEATFLQTERNIALLTHHSTALEAAHIAQQANAKKLLLGHFSARYKEKSAFLSEAQNIFPNTLLAEAGMKIQIPKITP
ncbi:MAG: ribonuclease Z [Flammeovirgaceae bacterium]|nr:ribonuclease Z [Flammeovirgaceae bacterium]MDW8286799.1 ribonuclease Z [Flammeovirgaceae bacterium]